MHASFYFYFFSFLYPVIKNRISLEEVFREGEVETTYDLYKDDENCGSVKIGLTFTREEVTYIMCSLTTKSIILFVILSSNLFKRTRSVKINIFFSLAEG